MFDLIIVGGGPAGAAAGVYAARKKLKTLFLTYDFGGQSSVSAEVQNWIGTQSISGSGLAEQLKAHLKAYEGEGLVIKEGKKATNLETSGKNFVVTDDEGNKYEGQTVLLATGASRRKLLVPGAAEFDQKGLTYCASCDGPLFGGKEVVVIGGGNAGFETAVQLLAYASHVTLLHHNNNPKADPVTIEKVKAHPNFTLRLNAETKEIKGEQFVTGLTYLDKNTNKTEELAVEGVFVEIGIVPNTAFARGVVELNEYNMVAVDPRTQRASVPGVWAAGDCADGLYHQNNIAAGDAVKALEDIYNYLYLETRV
jgi:alkyl hydroperoxide reductase subunit F